MYRQKWFLVIGILLVASASTGAVLALGANGDHLPSSSIQFQQDDRLGKAPVQPQPAADFKTRDDRLAEVGKQVPGFGGMFLNPDDRNILNVYLLDTEDTEQRAAVEAAIKRVFPDAIPPGGIQVIQGQYSVVQLKEWYDDMRVAVANSGLVGNGLVGTDLEEDKNRLEIAIASSDFQRKAEKAVDEAGIPREVVRITVREPFKMLPLRK